MSPLYFLYDHLESQGWNCCAVCHVLWHWVNSHAFWEQHARGNHQLLVSQHTGSPEQPGHSEVHHQCSFREGSVVKVWLSRSTWQQWKVSECTTKKWIQNQTNGSEVFLKVHAHDHPSAHSSALPVPYLTQTLRRHTATECMSHSIFPLIGM